MPCIAYYTAINTRAHQSGQEQKHQASVYINEKSERSRVILHSASSVFLFSSLVFVLSQRVFFPFAELSSERAEWLGRKNKSKKTFAPLLISFPTLADKWDALNLMYNVIKLNGLETMQQSSRERTIASLLLHASVFEKIDYRTIFKR